MNEVDAIFDAVAKASAAIIRADKRREELHRLWEASRPCCGNCFFWMKSSLCPREHNVKGYSQGPSMSGLACKKFERTKSAEEFLAQRNKMLNEEPSKGAEGL